MSILDRNIDEEADKIAESYLIHKFARQSKHYSFSLITPAVDYAVMVQQFIFDHWPHSQSCFKSVELDQFLTHNVSGSLFQSVTDQDILKQLQYEKEQHIWSYERLRNNQIYLPMAKQQLIYYCSRINDTTANDNTQSIAMQMKSMSIELPEPIITLNRSMVSPAYTAVIDYPTPCTIILQNIDELPSWFCWQTKDGFYTWAISIHKIYFYNSPNVPKEILDLPYVHTFEENDWLP